jgi:hypothetical protein
LRRSAFDHRLLLNGLAVPIGALVGGFGHNIIWPKSAHQRLLVLFVPGPSRSNKAGQAAN